jgi:hypothetical protein
MASAQMPPLQSAKVREQAPPEFMRLAVRDGDLVLSGSLNRRWNMRGRSSWICSAVKLEGADRECKSRWILENQKRRRSSSS